MGSFVLLLALAGDPALVALPAARPGIGEPSSFRGPVVVAMTSTTCPLSRKFAPVLARLSKTIDMVFVDVQGVDTRKEFERFAEVHGFKGKLLHDPQRKVARRLGATSTTEVFLIGRDTKLVYRGAVSDQYGVGVAHDRPRNDYLAAAIAAMRGGRKPPVVSTSAPGCALEFKAAEGKAGATWHGRIQHIVQRRCVRCHSDGGVAPFALETYEQVSDHAGMVGLTVRKKIMPPWFAAPGHRALRDDPSLSAEELRDVAAWLRAGRPKGDPKLAPAPIRKRDGWTIGEPDQIFELPRPIAVKAEGRMDYLHLRTPTKLAEDRWVTAWEVRPTARDVVHHVLVFALEPGRKRAPGGERGDFLADFVPGGGAAVYPEGLAKKLPKGSTLHFQVHYTPNGRATTDRTRIGLIYGKKPKHALRVEGICNKRIRIPPGAANHSERAAVSVPFDAVLLGFSPHMHYRGKSMRFEWIAPDNTRKTVLDVPRYDFNWQLNYSLAEPLRIPRGSRLQVTATFDNSAANAANPDPGVGVRWGLQSDDEMLIGYVEYYVPSISADAEVPKMRGSLADQALALLDLDGDRRVSRTECSVRLRPVFEKLDADRDGFLTRTELEPLNRRRRR